MCLICEKTFTNEGMKLSRIIDHLKAKHPEKANKDFACFRDLKGKFEKRPTIGALFNSCRNEVEKGLISSYKVSKLIAKCGKSHNIGETLIIPAVKKIISTIMATQKDVTLSIPLSNSTVSSRIDEMANDIENKLCDELKPTQFSLQLDETTLRDNEALSMVYVRNINVSRKVIEEFLFAEQLEVGTKGSTVYKAVEQFCKRKGIPLSNVIACATDGTPSMIGRHREFIAHLKREVPDLFTLCHSQTAFSCKASQ